MSKSKIPRLFYFTPKEINLLVENCNFTLLEEKILIMNNKGKSITAIALELYVSEATVSYHIRKIKDKILRSLSDLDLTSLKNTY